MNYSYHNMRYCPCGKSPAIRLLPMCKYVHKNVRFSCASSQLPDFYKMRSSLLHFMLFRFCFILFVDGISNLERLAYLYGSDKSKDDHNYIDLYSALFDLQINSTSNVTEIGVAKAQSIKLWHEYFPRAIIHGIDIRIPSHVRIELQRFPRAELYIANVLDSRQAASLNFYEESMDIIIDDGPHAMKHQEITLSNFWRYVLHRNLYFFKHRLTSFSFRYLKRGGFYIIEDVELHNDKVGFKEDHDIHSNLTKSILMENHAFIVDTTVAHRNWEHWLKVAHVKDHRVHNSYVLVIRKRIGDMPKVVTFTGSKS